MIWRILSLCCLCYALGKGTQQKNTSVNYDFEDVLGGGWICPWKTRTQSLTCPAEEVLNRSANSGGADAVKESSDAASSEDKPHAAGNCTNNLTRPEALAKPVDPTESAFIAISPQPIATFDEWTKEKLKLEQQKIAQGASVQQKVETADNGKNMEHSAATRNYASKECGAKVLRANAEAENTKAVLNDKEQDEYMRNPCEKAANKFLIVELCETVQLRSIALANFELFSSGPKDFRIWGAERLPQGDWELIGEFSAQDSRQLQQFRIDKKYYAKFIKMELLSYHGNEHYCTLSLIKVMGISMVDEYEAEAQSVGTTVVTSSGTPSSESESTGTKEAVESVIIEANTATTTSTTPSPITTTAVPPITEKASVSEIVGDVVSGRMLKKVVDSVKERIMGDVSKKAKSPVRRLRLTDCNQCAVGNKSTLRGNSIFCYLFGPRTSKMSSNKTSLMKHTRSLATMSHSRRLRRTRIAEIQRIALFERKCPEVTTETISTTTTTTTNVTATNTSANGTIVEKLEIQEDVTTNVDISQTTLNGQIALEALAPDSPPPTVNAKESVFLKLNKRIAALELNMSLSSEYLRELSRQYVAQTELHLKEMAELKKSAQEASEVAATKISHTIEDKINRMREELNSMSSLLSSLRATANQLSLVQLAPRSQGSPDDDDLQSNDAFEYKYDKKDNLLEMRDTGCDHVWTTEQVVYTVLCTQIVTMLFVAVLQLCSWSRSPKQNRPESESLTAAEVEAILERKLQSLENRASQSICPQQLSAKKKKKRRKTNGRPSEDPSFDSAVDTTSSSNRTRQSGVVSSESEGTSGPVTCKLENLTSEDELATSART